MVDVGHLAAFKPGQPGRETHNYRSPPHWAVTPGGRRARRRTAATVTLLREHRGAGRLSRIVLVDRVALALSEGYE